MENLRDRLNQTLNEKISRSHEYSAANVLLLYWQDADNSGFKQEADELGTTFRADFRYTVHHYAIQSEKSYLRLKSTISTFLVDHGGPDTLLIIYYGGHGDENNNRARNELRQSVWAARESGGPTLDWFKIQPDLYEVEADILVILDCCYSAQAARAYSYRGRVELLAACAMGVQCPPPGPHSFTTALIKVLKQVRTRGSATVSEINAKLSSLDSKLLQTPIHIGLQNDNRPSLTLEPLPIPGFTAGGQAMTSLTLHVSLRSKLSEETFQRIIQWLKSGTPREVSRFMVEDVCTSAERMRSLVLKEKALQLVGEDTRRQAIQFWTLFEDLLAGSGVLEASSAAALDSGQDEGSNSTAKAFLKMLSTQCSSLLKNIERDILSRIDLASPLREEEREALRHAGMEDMLKLRPAAIEQSYDRYSLELDSALLPLQDSHDRKLWDIQEVPEFGHVFIEYKAVEAVLGTSLVELKRRMATLTAVLQEEKSSEFQTLRSIRWVYDERTVRFSMVFELPTAATYGVPRACSLMEAIQNTRREVRPALDERFWIAKKIGEAIRKWHLAGWVHQSLSSRSIIFFYRQNSTRPDYQTPYLCGFDYTRPSDARSHGILIDDFDFNIYRHPDRQTRKGQGPGAAHRKIHDLYSYGILLLELGVWELAPLFLRKEIGPNLTSSKAKNLLIQHAEQRLGHYMGTRYRSAAIYCLTCDFGVELDDRTESRLSEAFNTRVLLNVDPLRVLN